MWKQRQSKCNERDPIPNHNFSHRQWKLNVLSMVYGCCKWSIQTRPFIRCWTLRFTTVIQRVVQAFSDPSVNWFNLHPYMFSDHSLVACWPTSKGLDHNRNCICLTSKGNKPFLTENFKRSVWLTGLVYKRILINTRQTALLESVSFQINFKSVIQN